MREVYEAGVDSIFPSSDAFIDLVILYSSNRPFTILHRFPCANIESSETTGTFAHITAWQ